MDVVFKFISCCKQWREKGKLSGKVHESLTILRNDSFIQLFAHVLYNILQRHVAVFLYNTRRKKISSRSSSTLLTDLSNITGMSSGLYGSYH